MPPSTSSSSSSSKASPRSIASFLLSARSALAFLRSATLFCSSRSSSRAASSRSFVRMASSLRCRCRRAVASSPCKRSFSIRALEYCSRSLSIRSTSCGVSWAARARSSARPMSGLSSAAMVSTLAPQPARSVQASSVQDPRSSSLRASSSSCSASRAACRSLAPAYHSSVKGRPPSTGPGRPTACIMPSTSGGPRGGFGAWP
mmetsp:Transcript_65244/g.183666  ORF Transcript_65244/g.183666 Transcript_65244/m.183666 type:complete len:203 (-) Transcript_65244:136-744(-)